MYQSLFVDFVKKSCLHSLCMCGVCSYFLKLRPCFLRSLHAWLLVYTLTQFFETLLGRTVHNRAMLNSGRLWLATTTIEQLYVVHKNASTLMPPRYLIRRHFAVASVSIPWVTRRLPLWKVARGSRRAQSNRPEIERAKSSRLYNTAVNVQDVTAPRPKCWV